MTYSYRIETDMRRSGGTVEQIIMWRRWHSVGKNLIVIRTKLSADVYRNAIKVMLEMNAMAQCENLNRACPDVCRSLLESIVRT